MKNLNIRERHTGDVTILDLAGNIRMGDDIVKLKKTLQLIVREGGKNILLNLTDILYIDSSGLGEMVAGYVDLQKNGGELKLFNLTDRVSELMIITKLLTVFEAFNSEAEALHSFERISEYPAPKPSDLITERPNKALSNQ